MNRLILLVLGAVMMCTPVFAQVSGSGQDRERAFWTKDVDKNSDWGKWLVTYVKPYTDQLSTVVVQHLSPIMQEEIPGTSPQDAYDKIRRAYDDYYRATQNITPPPELQTYHRKLLDLVAEVSKNVEKEPDAELIGRLQHDMEQELEKVLLRHGVPQSVIDKLTKQQK